MIWTLQDPAEIYCNNMFCDDLKDCLNSIIKLNNRIKMRRSCKIKFNANEAFTQSA